jgi:ribosomal protein S18 acetylase RimI-like enzyme
MGHVIADLPVGDVDRLEGLWRELLDHHLAAAPHLAALGDVRDPADSWRVRRAQYLQWLAVPRAAVLVARDADCLLGYAMIRAADAAGSWQWGDQVGTLETLVIGRSARGTGVGRELLDAARERLAEWGAQVMTISVIAGNETAVRFYRREGASDYLRTLIMPVRQPLSPRVQERQICVPLDVPRSPSERIDIRQARLETPRCHDLASSTEVDPGRAGPAVVEWLATGRPRASGRRLNGRSGRLLTAEKSPRGRGRPCLILG